MSRGAESTVTVTNAGGVFLSANARRIGVVITAPTTAHISITGNATAVSGQGLSLSPGTAPVYLGREMLGDWITKQLNAITSAGTETIGVVEKMEP